MNLSLGKYLHEANYRKVLEINNCAQINIFSFQYFPNDGLKDAIKANIIEPFLRRFKGNLEKVD